jgi:ribonucleoside-diphosphate reductase beta chain
LSSLLDLTVQGDVATIADESKLPQVKLMTPLQLYRLWERQNWVSHEIDLDQDRRDWEAMDEELRDEMAWGLSAFFVGEERVTNEFSGLVLSAEDKHEEAFLLTQQVDEARHAQHFNRLYEEVFHYDGSFEDRLERARHDLTADYFKLFDGYLVDAHQKLLADPSDIGAKVEFVTLYHMVIEGTLALTGQYFQTDNLEKRGILPGHLKAFNLISQVIGVGLPAVAG